MKPQVSLRFLSFQDSVLQASSAPVGDWWGNHLVAPAD